MRLLIQQCLSFSNSCIVVQNHSNHDGVC
jgi:hypothetical protein